MDKLKFVLILNIPEKSFLLSYVTTRRVKEGKASKRDICWPVWGKEKFFTPVKMVLSVFKILTQDWQLLTFC